MIGSQRVYSGEIVNYSKKVEKQKNQTNSSIALLRESF